MITVGVLIPSDSEGTSRYLLTRVRERGWWFPSESVDAEQTVKSTAQRIASMVRLFFEKHLFIPMYSPVVLIIAKDHRTRDQIERTKSPQRTLSGPQNTIKFLVHVEAVLKQLFRYFRSELAFDSNYNIFTMVEDINIPLNYLVGLFILK